MENNQYLITERAHLMCPNMHFGIKARIITSYDFAKIKTTIKLFVNAHPFIKSVIAKDGTTGKLYYKFCEEMQIPIIEKDCIDLWSKDYQSLTANGWDAFKECLLKVVVYPLKDGFEILFIAHHLLGDGRGILGLICEFADCYVTGKIPDYAKEQLIGSIQDLPEGSDLSLINKIIINKVNRNWIKENHTVSYLDYSDFEKQFIHDNPINYTEETWEAEKVNSLLMNCRINGISLNDYLIAEMMCEEHTNRVVIAADIRKQLSCYQEGSLGNYATAMGIVSNSKSEDVMEKAKDVAKQTKKVFKNNQKKMTILACYLRMHPELIDAAAISTMGDFQSKSGKHVGSLILGYDKRNAYSITNLGNIKNLNIKEAMFIPPASPANKTTMGVLSVNSRMKKCKVCY